MRACKQHNSQLHPTQRTSTYQLQKGGNDTKAGTHLTCNTRNFTLYTPIAKGELDTTAKSMMGFSKATERFLELSVYSPGVLMSPPVETTL